MDIALCIINLEKKSMNYAGAYNPLYLIRKNEKSGEYNLKHFKADRMPISVHINEKPFINNFIELKNNDLIYLFSDGFADQFGGKYGRKYFTKNFKRLLLTHCHKPILKQKEILYETFHEWKRNEDQIDDVMLIGFKIGNSSGDLE